MKEMGVPLDEGLPPPLDLPSPVMAPEDSIQRKEPVLRHNFCEHVQKMHQDKDALFLAEYQVLFTYVHADGCIHTCTVKPTGCKTVQLYFYRTGHSYFVPSYRKLYVEFHAWHILTVCTTHA